MSKDQSSKTPEKSDWLTGRQKKEKYPPLREQEPQEGASRDDQILKRHNEVLEQIIQDCPLSDILKNLCLEIEDHFGGEVIASVLLLDEDGRHLRHGAAPSLPDSYLQAIDGLEIGPEVGACGAAAYLKQPVYIPEIATHPYWRKLKDLALGHGLQACWSMPILARNGQALGTFGLYYPVPRWPTEKEREYVEFLAHSAAIAIEKVRAQEQLRQQTHALEVVNRIGASLTAELNLERLVQSVTDACCELTGAELGAFFYKMMTKSGEAYLLFTISGISRDAFDGFPMPRRTPLFAPTLSGEAVIRLGDVTADPRYGRMPPHHGMPSGHPPIRSYLAVPVVSRSGEVLGGLFFGHSKPHVFTQTAENIVKGIAPQAAIAIDNARLYQSAQKEIEERKLTAENLKRLASIVESSTDGIYSINLDGIITSWNYGAERIYGYTAPEIVGQSFSWLLPPELRQQAPAIIQQLLSKAGEAFQEALRTNKSGQIISVSLSISPSVDHDGTLSGASFIERDISEQKRMGAALQTSESRLHAILENSPAVIFVKDLEGRYQLVNKRFETIFRLSRKDFIGKTDYDLFAPDMANILRENDRKVLESRSPQEFEEQAEFHDGPHMYLSIKFPLFDGNDLPYAVGGMSTDITARKKAEQALKEINDTLEQRVADRTRDLLGYQENLKAMASELVLTEQRERKRLSTELHDYLAQLLVVCRMKLNQAAKETSGFPVTTRLEEIDRIISDSLSYTRTLIAELSPTILYELGLIPALIWIGQQMEQHGLRVSVQPEDQAIQLPEDHAYFLFQAVRELLFNVVKHAGVAEATVSLRRVSEQELEVLVRDAGNGFHPSLRSSAYAKPEKFGLFSIKERMEALGGKFQVDSQPGQGTCAILRVPLQPFTASAEPLIENKENRPLMVHLSQGDPKKKVVRILLVDDHAMIRQGIRTLLESQNEFLVVGEAQNGEEALEVTNVVSPDVVVMDVNMPKLNGIEATRLLTQEHPSIKIIGLSVHEDKQIEQLLLQAGARSYVTKGSVASQLVEAIRAVIKLSP